MAEVQARRGVRVAALRAAVLDAVSRTSLRAVAGEVGTTPPTLTQFLEGSHPRPPTMSKLREWYFSLAAAHAGDVSLVTARAALLVLLEGLPERERTAVLRKFIDSLLRAHRRQRTAIPPWLQSLSEDGQLATSGVE
jgi:hypothetical protein